jgi:hypothetical protein
LKGFLLGAVNIRGKGVNQHFIRPLSPLTFRTRNDIVSKTLKYFYIKLDVSAAPIFCGGWLEQQPG